MLTGTVVRISKHVKLFLSKIVLVNDKCTIEKDKIAKFMTFLNFFCEKKVGFGFRDGPEKITPDPTWPKFRGGGGGNKTPVV